MAEAARIIKVNGAENMMNVRALKKKLKEQGVPESWYSINGRMEPDCYILNQKEVHWEVFYLDADNKVNGYKTFDNENDACKYFEHKLEKEMERY